mmetsp:Transcript_18858/g.28672  ORF Transcript_18858/g.28672 Transcript_18858/m.28672 type:complete len:552 (+) Transcript_18858:43-1698(+)
MKSPSSIATIAVLIASSVLESSCAGLRNYNQRELDHLQAARNEPFITCNVSKVHGITPPSLQSSYDNRLVCTSEATDLLPERAYFLSGSTVQGVDISAGGFQIQVSQSSIDDGYIINMNDTSMGDKIRIVHEEGRKLNNNGIIKEGNFKILAVRVSNDTTGFLSVEQSEEKLANDIFEDENNVETIYRKCSNNKVLLKKATGPNVNEGIVTINPPHNLCDMNWMKVTNMVLDELNSLQHNADYIMIIMPDCVDFQEARAWGFQPGHITAFQTSYASYPVTQVHELGHNMGQSHSAKGNSDYGDNTGYMGNQAIWSDSGSMMCFNSAKLWYFEWYSDFHRTIDAMSEAYDGDLVGMHDIRMGNVQQGSMDFIVKVQRGATEIFVMFNRKDGATRGVEGSADKVVITQQNGSAAPSLWLGDLGNSDRYTFENWGDNNENLIVESCSIELSTVPAKAHIIIYVEGATDIACPQNEVNETAPNEVNEIDSTSSEEWIGSTLSSTSCIDTPNWYDSDGLIYNCGWYAQGSNCFEFGNSFENFGETANTGCCVCQDK